MNPVTKKSRQYIPKLTLKEIEENHKRFDERISLYKKRGLDFLKTRESILKKAQFLPGNILEIGTGTGHTTLALAKAGYEFISIDKDREALKTAALNLAYENVLSKVKFYVMDGESLDFANSSFNNIVIVNLFHHLDNANEVLSETDRVLSTSGRLILADFNERGMKIVGSVHKSEGHIHKNSGVSKDYVYFYLRDLGYKIENYEDKHHWILISKKQITQ